MSVLRGPRNFAIDRPAMVEPVPEMPGVRTGDDPSTSEDPVRKLRLVYLDGTTDLVDSEEPFHEEYVGISFTTKGRIFRFECEDADLVQTVREIRTDG